MYFRPANVQVVLSHIKSLVQLKDYVANIYDSVKF